MAKDDAVVPITLMNADLSQMKVERLKAESQGLFFVAGGERRPFAADSTR